MRFFNLFLKKLKKRKNGISASSEGLVSAGVVLLGFSAGTVLIVLAGRNPAELYFSLLQSVSGWYIRWNPDQGGWIVRFNGRYIGEWLALSLPLILCGLSMAFAARTGLFNIGAEGQYIAGLTAAQVFALYGPPVPFLHWFAAVSAGCAAGAIWGGLAGFLKARFNVSEVVATIMMNYIAFYGSRYCTLLIPGTNTHHTPPFPATSLLANPFLKTITNGSRLNLGLYLTIGAVFLYWIIMEKTRLGYALRATGFNKDAARYGGINVNAGITGAMAISGGFAGLAGAVVSLGLFSAGRVLSAQDGYGFDGIAVALVGNSRAGGTALAGLLFGMLKTAQPLMQSRQIPKEIASIIMGLVVVFISLRAGIRILLEQQMKKYAAKAMPGLRETPGGK
ncbi:MAG: ABC transporter permease [Spirochaetaceae bacterium]|jgi:simple sugar transport system permease protein|nr:ABC transporter permease [Spirochaetaceae bacterium]